MFFMRYARFLAFAVCTAAMLVVISLGQFAEPGLAQPIPLPGREDPPRVTATRPANLEVNVLRNTAVAADVTFPPITGNGVDPSTLNINTVYLHPTGNPGNKVPAEVNTSGGNDSIVLTPEVLLASNTSYTFVVTSAVKDLQGNAFEPYTMSFTTGTNDGTSPTPVEFTKATAITGQPGQYTTLVIPKDNRLYASMTSGVIRVFNINPNGTLSLSHDITTFSGRAVIGMAETTTSTANNVVLWVVNNDAYTGGNDAAHFSGHISKLTNTGGNSYSKQDYIVGLPRSRKDHLTNSIVYGPDGALYVTQGSLSAMGRADPTWGNQPEVLLSAAVLRIDPALLEAYVSSHDNSPLDVRTADVSGNEITQNYGLGEVPGNLYDPLETNAPLTIFATGIRNGYDLAWHSNGQLYVPANGSAAGGNVPGYAAGTPCQNRIDKGLFGNFDWQGTQPPQVINLPTQNDYLFRVVSGGYYGHPNPERCEWVANGGNPTAGADPAEVIDDPPPPATPTRNGYDVGVQPDRNWRGFAFNFGKNSSPDGVIEYKTNIYDGNLRGKLLVVRYSAGKDIVTLTPGGSAANFNIINAEYGITGFTGFSNPLDLVEDLRNGNIYVAEFGSEQSINGKISVLKPINPNAAPLVNTDSYSIMQPNTLLVGAANGVLKNDSDLNGDPMTALLWTAPPNKQFFQLNPDGSFTYLPKSNFTGVDSFSYKVSDGKTSSAVATVYISVLPGPTITPGGPTFTPPPVQTDPATETPIPAGGRQLVLNGGFEGGVSAEGVPSNWEVSKGKGEKVKCNDPEKLVAYQGQCAFMFKKSAAEDSRLKQVLNAGSINVTDTLVTSFYAAGKNIQADVARAMLKIKYADNSKDKIRLYVASGTTVYTKYTKNLVVAKVPTKVKLYVRFNGTTGKYYVDNLSVVALPFGSAAEFSVNPLALP
jgi:glucose/arabinose dehydrogenase